MKSLNLLGDRVSTSLLDEFNVPAIRIDIGIRLEIPLTSTVVNYISHVIELILSIWFVEAFDTKEVPPGPIG